MLQLLPKRQWKSASRIVFFLTAVGTALMVKGARPRVMDDSTLEVDHPHTEIPVETRDSILGVSQLQTESTSFPWDIVGPSDTDKRRFDKCVGFQREHLDTKAYPIVMSPTDTPPTTVSPEPWEHFKMCTKIDKTIPPIAVIQNVLEKYKSKMTTSMDKYITRLRAVKRSTDEVESVETPDAVEESFEKDFHTCFDFHTGNMGPKDTKSTCEQQPDFCQRQSERCMKFVLSAPGLVKAAIEKVHNDISNDVKTLVVDRLMVSNSLVEQLKHTMPHYTLSGKMENNFKNALDTAAKDRA